MLRVRGDHILDGFIQALQTWYQTHHPGPPLPCLGSLLLLVWTLRHDRHVQLVACSVLPLGISCHVHRTDGSHGTHFYHLIPCGLCQLLQGGGQEAWVAEWEVPTLSVSPSSWETHPHQAGLPPPSSRYRVFRCGLAMAALGRLFPLFCTPEENSKQPPFTEREIEADTVISLGQEPSYGILCQAENGPLSCVVAARFKM